MAILPFYVKFCFARVRVEFLRGFFEDNCIKIIKVDPYYQQQKCSTWTLVPGNIRYMRILRVFPGDKASNNSGVIENTDFQVFRTLCLWPL